MLKSLRIRGPTFYCIHQIRNKIFFHSILNNLVNIFSVLALSYDYLLAGSHDFPSSSLGFYSRFNRIGNPRPFLFAYVLA